MPASSPSWRERSSTENPFFSAQRLYIRSSMDVQSCASVPPTPLFNVRITSLLSYSPDKRTFRCMASTPFLRSFTSPKSKVCISPSSSVSSTISRASSTLLERSLYSFMVYSIAFSSCVTCLASSRLFQKDPSCILKISSSLRLDNASMSKRHPDFFQ